MSRDSRVCLDKQPEDSFGSLSEHALEVCSQNILIEAGCDEAGRGPLAGPVFAAAVILPPQFYHHLLNDSKKMSEKNREILREVIQKQAVAWAVEEVSTQRIDEINILNASFEAMTKAVMSLSTHPQMLLIDGNRFKTELAIEYKCVVRGDAKYANIAAASVLAKTYRDDRMRELDKMYPQYGWHNNKGYPTKQHRLALREYGPSPHHRMSYLHEKNLNVVLELAHV